MIKDENAGIVLKKQLARLLQEKSLTASELSRRAGVPKQTISDWLGGIAPRNLPALLRIAKVLETSIERLVFGEPGSSPGFKQVSKPLRRDHEFVFGQELVIITERGLISYLSPALLRILGEQDLYYQGRPIYEFVHIDDIPSMLDWHINSPHCFRIVGLHGETRMTLHSAMPLGASDIVVHHLAPIISDDTSRHHSNDFFDVRDLVDAMARILRRNCDTSATSCRITYGTQPVYVCSVRPLLGRLLLSMVHDLGKIHTQRSTTPASHEEIAIEVEDDDRDFRIRFQGQVHDLMQRVGAYVDLVQACGVSLKVWTTQENLIAEIQGPRIFLTPRLTHGIGQSRKI